MKLGICDRRLMLLIAQLASCRCLLLRVFVESLEMHGTGVTIRNGRRKARGFDLERGRLVLNRSGAS